MSESTIALRIQQYGAEQVRQRLREIKEELAQGAPVTRSLKKEISELNTQATAQTRIVQILDKSWLAQHQTLQLMARTMSAVGSVARNMLAITTAFSVATLAFSKNNSSLVEAEAELARANRELQAAIESGDPERIARAAENINVLKARIKELQDNMQQEQITGVLNTIATAALILGGVTNTLAKVGPRLLPILEFFMGLTPVLASASVLAAVVAGTIAAIAAIFYMALTPGDQFQQFVNTFFPQFAEQVEYVGKIIDDVFAMHIPNAFIFMANRALDVFDTIIIGGQIFVNHFISIINGMIAAVNRISGAIGLPQIATIPAIAVGGVTGGARIPYLESRNWGAGGPGTFKGSTSNSGINTGALVAGGALPYMGAAAPTINITINGDVSGEELVDKVRMAMKNNMRGLGFTGFE